jgi:hypothetical protein
MTKDKSETAKVSSAPPSSDYIKAIRVVCEVELRPKDQKVPDRVILANKVVERMSETIQRGSFFPPNKGDITLKITVMACSEGSRCGRICCGELGVGWVMLDCDWLLMRGAAKSQKSRQNRFDPLELLASRMYAMPTTERILS